MLHCKALQGCHHSFELSTIIHSSDHSDHSIRKLFTRQLKAEKHLQQLLGLDDYIKETVGAKLTIEYLPWRMREDPMFDSCETEKECADQHNAAKDRYQLSAHQRQSHFSRIVLYSVDG